MARQVVPYEDEEEWLPPVPAALPPQETPPQETPQQEAEGAGDGPGPEEATPAPADDDRVETLVERVVEALEQRLAAPGAPERAAPPDRRGEYWSEHLAAGEVAALRQEVAMAMEQVSRLAAEVSRTQQRSDEQRGATELRLGAIDALADAVGALAAILGGRSVALAFFQTTDDDVPLGIAARIGEPTLLTLGEEQFELPATRP
jgi:hypothetical protein